MRASRVARASAFVVATMLAGLLTPISAAQAVPPFPYALVDSPADGSVITTPSVTVTGEGHTDPAGLDTVFTLALRVDGVVTGPTTDCTLQGTPFDCTGSFTWDTSALAPGEHTLAVELIELTTVGLVVQDSPAITVVPPPPTVVINSPADGGTATGPVTVSATGTVDPLSTDIPKSLQLVVAGVPQEPAMTCPPTPNVCTWPLVWDSTSVATGTRTLRVRFVSESVAHVLTTTTSDPITLTADNPGPSVNITSPSSNGTEQKGAVSVSATGTGDGSTSETSVKLELLDGGSLLDTQPCAGTLSPCTAALTWDATGQPIGNVTLTVKYFTHDGLTATDTVSVHVTSPAPTASISSPVDGETVSGVVPITATGTVDPSQTDHAATMQLYVDDAAYGSAFTCPATATCPATFNWDASGLNSPHKLHVKFSTSDGNSFTTSDITVNASANPPIAAITGPANGATVSGPVTVTTTGSISASQNDSATSMQLLVDNVAVGPATACSAGAPKLCSQSFSWDTTGLSGTHTLQTKFLTHKGFLVLSPATTVTVVSPAPTAVITSPVTNATVPRGVTVTVSGTVDPTQSDAPATMLLTVDGIALGNAIPCTATPAAPRTCVASFTWTTLGLTGKHTLLATFATRNGVVTNSAVVPVYVYAGTATAFKAVKSMLAGHKVTVTGRVIALADRSGAIGAKVKILIVPARGKAKSMYVLTDAHGYFKVAVKPTINTTVEATVVSPAYYGFSHTFTKLKVTPGISCVAGASLFRNQLDQASCHVPNLPKTTKVTLQYQYLGHWYTLGTGGAPGAVVPFSFRFAKRGNYLVRLVIAPTSVFLGITGPSLKVVVT